MAAGLSLREEKIEPFRNALNENCTLTDSDFLIFRLLSDNVQ